MPTMRACRRTMRSNRLAAQARAPSPRRLIVMFPLGACPRPQSRRCAISWPTGIHDVPPDESAAELYARYAPDRFFARQSRLSGRRQSARALADRVSAKRIPNATRSQGRRGQPLRNGSRPYDWLFQDRRYSQAGRFASRGLVEEQALRPAFCRTGSGRAMRSAGLVPSLASAIGSSGDRPDSLATLMGIILKRGRKTADDGTWTRVHFSGRHALRHRIGLSARNAAAGHVRGSRRHAATRSDGRRRRGYRGQGGAESSSDPTAGRFRSAARPAPAITASSRSVAGTG